MKDRKGTRKLLAAFCLISVLSAAVAGQIRCKYNEFEVEDVVGNHSCVPCKSCPVGDGLSPQCGSYIPYGTHIECKPCVSGVSYSSTSSIESCQPCGICVDHQKVLQKCNRTHNSVCAKNCDVGFYLSLIVGDCQECSWCCPGSSPSEQKADCKKDGVPFYKHCSVDESIRCKPRCTNHQYIVVAKNLDRTCHDCPHCGVGRGLYPKCQSVLASMKEAKCQGCIPGKTYSDTTDYSSCKPCKVCGVGKKVERSCNKTHDTLCGDCDHGFYNESIGDNKEANCKHCSYCCGDDQDVIIPECKAQGMSKDMQCAYTKRAITKCAPTHGNKKNIIIIVLVIIIVLLITIGGFVVYKYKNPKRYKYSEMAKDESLNESLMDSTQDVPIKESPSHESKPNNIEFRHSGIIVHCHDNHTGEVLLRDMTVQICWDEHKNLPKRKEIYLSPLIRFHPPGLETQTPITLDIPHSAYQQEENNTWKIKVLKVSSPIKDEEELKLTKLSNNTETKVNPCSLRFTVTELATYVVVGEIEPGLDPKLAKKRMKCAVFGGVPKVGETYSVMIYLLDDGDPSLKKLQQDEKKKGRELLQKSIRSLYPDVYERSEISVAIENVKEGWQKLELSKDVIECSEWINSYQAIPKVEASFKHINLEIRDFHCTLKLKFKDNVMETQIFHCCQSISEGIQPSDQHESPDDTHVGISEESQAPMNSLQFLSSIPNEVLTNFCQSIDQAIGEDHTHIESVAAKIIPSITPNEVGFIGRSSQPFTNLIDLASSKGIELKAANVKHALEAEGLNSNMLMPYLYVENSSQLV